MAGLTNAHVDADSGDAYPDTLGATWATPSSWSAWNHWDANPHTTIEYIHELDAGTVSQCVPNVSVTASADSVVTTESHSSDGSTWTAYAAIGNAILARYVRIKVVASGPYPILRDLTVALLGDRKEQFIADLNTSTLTGANRIGVGDIRLPVSGVLTLISGVSLAFNNTGPAYSWELIDKAPSPGPRIKIYDASGNPADCVIDAIIKGA